MLLLAKVGHRTRGFFGFVLPYLLALGFFVLLLAKANHRTRGFSGVRLAVSGLRFVLLRSPKLNDFARRSLLLLRRVGDLGRSEVLEALLFWESLLDQ